MAQRTLTYEKYVYCLEGDWLDDLRKHVSVKPALEFMQLCSGIKYIHRNCATREQIGYYLKKYSGKKYEKFSILYFAFHGEPHRIRLGKEWITLDELADLSEGLLRGKIIHFGTCSTINIDTRYIKKFLKATGALCVCGYATDIDFLPGSVFDLLLFEICQNYKDIRFIERDMRRYYGKLIKMLGFRMIHL
jgi:hypothetical protein